MYHANAKLKKACFLLIKKKVKEKYYKIKELKQKTHDFNEY